MVLLNCCINNLEQKISPKLYGYGEAHSEMISSISDLQSSGALTSPLEELFKHVNPLSLQLFVSLA
jgi:hypothetical protein